MAAAKSVGAGKGDDLLVIEAHAVEDVTEVVVGLRGVGKTAVGGLLGLDTVDASGPPGDDGAASLLDSGDTAEGPEVTVRDPGELLLDALHVVAGNVEAVVGTVAALVGETHGSVVGAARAVLLVVGARRVPGKTEDDGSERAVWYQRLAENPPRANVESLDHPPS